MNAKQAYLDSMGYEPYATHIVFQASTGQSLYSNSNRKLAIKWLRNNGYEMIVNPRFAGYTNLIQEVAEANSYGGMA